MSTEITLRIWTAMGKENICNVSDFRVHNGEIEIMSSDIDRIHNIVKTGSPCCLSFLVCTSDNDEVGQYREHQYRGCSLVKDRIRFMALCVPSAD